MILPKRDEIGERIERIILLQPGIIKRKKPGDFFWLSK